MTLFFSGVQEFSFSRGINPPHWPTVASHQAVNPKRISALLKNTEKFTKHKGENAGRIEAGLVENYDHVLSLLEAHFDRRL